MLKQPLLVLSAILSFGLLAGCASSPTYTPASFQPEAIGATAYAPKVDSFVVTLDVSSSMMDAYQGRTKFYIAKDFVANLNQTIPPLNYEAGLVTFGKSSGCTFGDGTADVVYGLAPYQGADFATALNSLEHAGGTTPMDKGINATSEALSAESGAVAVILVSDFWQINSTDVMNAVSKLKALHGDNLCLYPVKVGDYAKANAVIADMTGLVGCGKSMNAADLASPGAMAGYVTEVLLEPVPQEKPIQYEKVSFSATALFDFDKAVLKEQGKVELHTLDEYIKSKGVNVVDINVIGHTDSKGSAEYNQGLSERRATAVKEYMVSEGIDASIIDASGEGESNPVADNSTSEGQALNRRVDVHVGATQQLD
jgi:OOP family OmpA-OmpF porin